MHGVAEEPSRATAREKSTQQGVPSPARIKQNLKMISGLYFVLPSNGRSAPSGFLGCYRHMNIKMNSKFCSTSRAGAGLPSPVQASALGGGWPLLFLPTEGPAWGISSNIPLRLVAGLGLG